MNGRADPSGSALFSCCARALRRRLLSRSAVVRPFRYVRPARAVRRYLRRRWRARRCVSVPSREADRPSGRRLPHMPSGWERSDLLGKRVRTDGSFCALHRPQRRASPLRGHALAWGLADGRALEVGHSAKKTGTDWHRCPEDRWVSCFETPSLDARLAAAPTSSRSRRGWCEAPSWRRPASAPGRLSASPPSHAASGSGCGGCRWGAPWA